MPGKLTFVCQAGFVCLAGSTFIAATLQPHHAGDHSRPRPPLEQAAGNEPGWVCLRTKHFVVTTDDVEDFRVLLQPPPRWDEAVALTSDASLAAFEAYGTLDGASLRERRAAYGRFVEQKFAPGDTATEMAQKIELWRKRVETEHGARRLPCVPVSESARDVR